MRKLLATVFPVIYKPGTKPPGCQFKEHKNEISLNRVNFFNQMTQGEMCLMTYINYCAMEIKYQ